MRGATFLPVVVAGRDDGGIVGCHRLDERGQRLGQLVRVVGRVGEEHLGDAVELGRLVGGGARTRSGNEDVDVRTDGLGGRQRLVGRVLEARIVVLGDEEGGHDGYLASRRWVGAAASSGREATGSGAPRPEFVIPSRTFAAPAGACGPRAASSKDAGLVPQLADEVLDILDEDATATLGRLRGLHDLETRGDVEP